MKKIIFIFICMLSLQATQAFDQQEAFRNLYSRLSLSGSGSYPDINGMDEGSCNFIRQLINLNELTTDVVYTIWRDPGLTELASAMPESDNPLVLGMYRRLEYNILKCNEFLDNTSDDDAESKRQRAEARFLRAYYYSLAIDLWGDMPLWKTAADSPATRSSRQEVFEFVTQELTSCADDMALPADSQYGRADRVAAWMLLARLYLNAEVYTGTARWQQAKDYAQLVIDSDYALCDHYSYLFMGDNDSNGAQSEIILPAVVDGLTQYDYGNTMFVISATHASDMPPCGLSSSWAGYYARYSLLTKFFQAEDIPSQSTEGTVAAAGDDRCLLYGIGRLQGQQLGSNFTDGFSIDKFTNNCVYGTASSEQFPDTDFPLMRVAEAYLCYAEADARQNGGSCSTDGLEKLNALRQRAHATTLAEATLSDLADEWCREFYLEGQRRSHLIRFGLFAGDDYLWTGKGGTDSGQALKAFRNLMPMPEEVLVEHPQYTQNTGYSDPNFIPDDFVLNTPAFGSEIVDLSSVDAMRLSWQRPSNLPEEGNMKCSLELSVNPDFNDPKTSFAPNADAFEVWVDARNLNSFLLSNNDQAYLSTSVKVYARCVTNSAVSNTVELNLKAYDNRYEQMPQPWYFVGNCIGDGQWDNSISKLGQSMFPMNINADGSSVYTGYFHEGDSFVMVNKPGSWEECVKSNDGSVYGLRISEGGENINIYETGWYTFQVYPQWGSAYCMQVSDQGWPVYTSMVMASGLRGSVVTEMTSCNPANPYNHVWYARVSFDGDDTVYFRPDGNETAKVGGEAFPYGYATDASQTIPVRKGNYVVFFDDMTGYYQFADATTGLLPQLFSRNYRQIEVAPVDVVHLNATTATIKLCDIVMPEDVEVSQLHLVIGDEEFVINEQGEVNTESFVAAMKRRFGQYGLHNAEVQAVMAGIQRDLARTFKSEPFTLTVQMLSMPVEEHYYYVGSQTLWDFNNLSMPMTCLSGDQWASDPRFQIDITIPAGQDDWFNIFPASALTSDDPWSNILRPMENGDNMSGTFGISNAGYAWHISAPTQQTTYRLTLDFNTATYAITEAPAIPTPIQSVQYGETLSRQPLYDLQGRPVASPHGKGIYIIRSAEGRLQGKNHKKVARY